MLPTTTSLGWVVKTSCDAAAGSTSWPSPADVLPVKFASPAYVAVSVCAPAAVSVSVQLPAATLAVQLCVPSVTVTLPVGVPPMEVTENATVNPTPATDGSGVSLVIVVVVLAVFTVWLTPVDVLTAKLPSPA